MKGIDISNNNGDINFDNIVKSGIDTVYIKASEGTTYKDIFCQMNYNLAKDRNLNIGFYHFLVGSSSPETQAKNFYECIKDKKYNCIPCIDVELNFYGVNDYLIRFINEFKKLSNQDLIIYTGLNFGNENLRDVFINNKFWLAHYTGKAWKYGYFKFPNIVGHQYTEKGKIFDCDKNFDLNVFTNDILIDCESVQNKNFVKIEGKIAELQDLCNQILATNLVIDNIYGNNTDKAIKRLPLLSINGINDRRLVTWVQLRLGIEADGIFGSETRLNVRYFQSRNALEIDGVVGYNTYKKLCLI